MSANQRHPRIMGPSKMDMIASCYQHESLESQLPHLTPRWRSDQHGRSGKWAWKSPGQFQRQLVDDSSALIHGDSISKVSNTLGNIIIHHDPFLESATIRTSELREEKKCRMCYGQNIGLELIIWPPLWGFGLLGTWTLLFIGSLHTKDMEMPSNNGTAQRHSVTFPMGRASFTKLMDIDGLWVHDPWCLSRVAGPSYLGGSCWKLVGSGKSQEAV